MEAVKKRESEIAKARARKQSANAREAETLFKSLLAERIRDGSLTWEESYPVLEKDPLKRAQSEILSTESMEKMFQKHVGELLERDANDFNSLLKQVRFISILFLANRNVTPFYTKIRYVYVVVRLVKQVLGSKEALLIKEKEKLQKLVEESKTEKLDWKELYKQNEEMVRFFVEESDFEDSWESYEVAKQDLRLDPRFAAMTKMKSPMFRALMYIFSAAKLTE